MGLNTATSLSIVTTCTFSSSNRLSQATVFPSGAAATSVANLAALMIGWGNFIFAAIGFSGELRLILQRSTEPATKAECSFANIKFLRDSIFQNRGTFGLRLGKFMR